jgi:hypothetical protein
VSKEGLAGTQKELQKEETSQRKEEWRKIKKQRTGSWRKISDCWFHFFRPIKLLQQSNQTGRVYQTSIQTKICSKG